jgi:hypothetical protein
VSPQDILVDFFGRRNFAADIAIILSFLVLYGLLAAVLLGRLLRRYPVEESWPVTLAMTALASLAFGFGGMLLGEQWSAIAENIRVAINGDAKYLGFGHLGPRSLPWTRHELGFFVLCVVLFWGAAVARFRVHQHLK